MLGVFRALIRVNCGKDEMQEWVGNDKESSEMSVSQCANPEEEQVADSRHVVFRCPYCRLLRVRRPVFSPLSGHAIRSSPNKVHDSPSTTIPIFARKE